MINKNYIKLIRSDHRFDENNFIYKIIAKRIIDSIDLLNVKIDQVMEIGINENVIYNHINNKFPNSKFTRSDLCLSKSLNNKLLNFKEIDLNNLNFKSNFYNLIYSNCFIHIINNFENCLDVILKSLKNNGFFITAIPDKDSMFQLLNSMYETDLFLYNGAYQRVNPTIEINNILPILKKLQFDAPSIYTDTISIDYNKFENLIKDVKKMNLTFNQNDKRQNFENKNYFNILEKFYRKKYFKESYPLEIKINFISAWKK